MLSRLRRLSLISAVLAGAALVVAACTTAPVTGRSQMILISPQESRALGVQAFNQIKSDKRIITGTDQARMVERVGRNIADVVGSTGGHEWEFVLFDDPTPNAFALPGGKVGVHTGLFDVAETEAQFATVMAHEIGHVMAQHSAERVSRQMMTQLGVQAVGAATQSRELTELLATSATLGVTLPFTRDQESEADHIGLIYMARAGYDPRTAVELWQNFADAGGNRPPQFLSTHPNPENRIERLREVMPEALEFYNRGANLSAPGGQR